MDLRDVLPKLKDIISKELGEKKVYDKDVATVLGIKQLSFATMKKRGRIPYEEVLNFCAKRKISINWLLYDQFVETLQEETEKFTRIRYFGDIYASAGGGAFNYEELYEHLTLDEKMINKLGGEREAKNIDAINVKGDSMEPTFHDGDIIFLNRTCKDIRKGGIFVVGTNNGLFVKRVFLKTDGTLDLISDNKFYSIENVLVDHVEIIGKVVGAVSKM